MACIRYYDGRCANQIVLFFFYRLMVRRLQQLGIYHVVNHLFKHCLFKYSEQIISDCRLSLKAKYETVDSV